MFTDHECSHYNYRSELQDKRYEDLKPKTKLYKIRDADHLEHSVRGTHITNVGEVVLVMNDKALVCAFYRPISVI